MITVENDIAVSGDVRVAVIGVGGAGCRIASMLYGKMSRVGVIAINTDRKALEETSADVRLYICKEVTKGLGTNGDPALGKKCAQIHEAEITSAVSKYDYAYIVAGMGGGTGSGAASVVAELCDRAGVKVGAVAIMPFSFESGRPMHSQMIKMKINGVNSISSPPPFSHSSWHYFFGRASGVGCCGAAALAMESRISVSAIVFFIW